MEQLPLFPLSQYREFVAVDCETTGLDPKVDRLVEIAVHRFINGQPIQLFQRIVDPGVPIPPSASAVHFLTDYDVEGTARPQEALEDLATFVSDSVVVAHNAPFDRSFLPTIGHLRWACSMRLARHIWPTAPSFKNQVLRFLLNLSHPALTGRPAHRAAADAMVTGLIFERGVRAFVALRPDGTILDLLDYIRAPLSIAGFDYGYEYRGWPIHEIPSQYLEWVVQEAAGPAQGRHINVDPDTLKAVQEILELNRAA